MVLQLDDGIFPENLKHMRKKRGFSKIALARKTGVSVYLIRGIESGIFYSQVPREDYEQPCAVLQVQMEILGYVLIT